MKAYAGKKGSATSTTGAGIGGGYKCNGANVNIQGGTVTASSVKAVGAGDKADDDGDLSLYTWLSVKGGSDESCATVAPTDPTDQRENFCRKAWAKIWYAN